MDVIEVKKVEQRGFLLIEEDSCSHLSTAIANSESAVQVADNKVGWISCYDVGRFNISPSKFQSLMNTRSLVGSWLFRGPAAPLL